MNFSSQYVILDKGENIKLGLNLKIQVVKLWLSLFKYNGFHWKQRSEKWNL